MPFSNSETQSQRQQLIRASAVTPRGAQGSATQHFDLYAPIPCIRHERLPACSQVPTNNLNHRDWFPSSSYFGPAGCFGRAGFSQGGTMRDQRQARGSAWPPLRNLTPADRSAWCRRDEDVLEHLGAVENERLAARGAGDLQPDRQDGANRPSRYLAGQRLATSRHLRRLIRSRRRLQALCAAVAAVAAEARPAWMATAEAEVLSHRRDRWPPRNTPWPGL
jgi:hypothetical protein